MEHCEDLWIELKPGPGTPGRKMFIGLYYRPPDSSAEALSAAVEEYVMRLDVRAIDLFVIIP